MVPAASREVEDRTRPMTAPEVDLKGKLPPAVAEKLDQALERECRALLADPEEQETRWFGVFDQHLEELGRNPVGDHVEILEVLDSCRGGAITVQGVRYRIEIFKSFNEFGDRLVLQFFEEGRLDAEHSIERRQENIRLVNRLKPATSLTAKNELDIYGVLSRNPREHSFVDLALKEGLLTSEDVERIPPGEDYELRVLQGNIFPRKMAAMTLAHYLGVDYLDVEAASFSKEAARLLTREWELDRQVVPFAQDGQELKVAMMDPTDTALIAEIAEKTGLTVRAFCSAAQDIVGMIHKAHKRDD
jgi:hypothetical protein